MKRIFFILFSFVVLSDVHAEFMDVSQTNLSGKITDKTGEPIIGVSIYFPELKTGAMTNAEGTYRIDNLPKRTMLIQISSVGYKTITGNIDLSAINQKDFVLEESVIEINEVAVTGQAVASQIAKTPAPISTVSRAELLQHSASNIIDALSSQPGVSQITTGSGISKPVIRGLGYNRVVVVNEGVRQEGQQWGDEHGVEIDENDVSRVEILKGPASLMYGSDAMAGVISLFSSPILPQGEMELNALANYQTNNGLMAYSLNFAGHKKTFVWDLRYSNKKAHAYQNKYDGYVFNSGFSENAISGMGGISDWWGYSHLSFSAYHLVPGIVEGERNPVTGQFTKLIALNDSTSGEAIASGNDFTGYGHFTPFQRVNHYKLVWNNNFLIGEGSFKANVGYQQNHRREFADILNPNSFKLYFRLHTLNYSFIYQLPEVNGFNFSAGINGMYQRSLNKGVEFLVPEYRLFDAGAFIIGKKSIGKLDVSGGIRIDNRAEHSDALYLDISGNRTTGADLTATRQFSAFSGNFGGISGSAGATLPLNENWITKLNLSQGFRAPNISELGSNGVHEGTIRYEIGNQELDSERSLQLDYELGFTTEHVNAKLNLFANNIANYIYLHKISGANGGDSIQNGYPCYKFDAGNAQLLGGEFYIDIHPHPWDWLHFENSFSYVRSELLDQPDSTRYLPFTPAPRWISNIRFDFNDAGNVLKNMYFNLGCEYNFKQLNIYSAYNTETETAAYTLINAGMGADVVWKKRTLFSFFVNGTNLADIAYQSHLSRLKYAAENPVTGRVGVFNMGRNISFKLVVPVNL